MEVYGHDPYISIAAAWKLSRNIKPSKSLEDVCRDCDFITIHVPAMDSTKGMINKDLLAVMKDGVIVLNFSRDSLINDEDMIEALKSGKVAKYVTDFPNEKITRGPRNEKHHQGYISPRDRVSYPGVVGEVWPGNRI